MKSDDEDTVTVYCKGAVRGKDPQLKAYGFVVSRKGSILKRGYGLLDIKENKSNHFAEYRTMILAFDWLEENISDLPNLVIKTGSDLVVNQLKGEWNVNSSELEELYEELTTRVERLSEKTNVEITFEHIPKGEKNPAEEYTEHAFKDYKLVGKIKKEDKKVCPKCGSEMVLRKGKYGKFYGCKGYPDCKHTEELE